MSTNVETDIKGAYPKEHNSSPLYAPTADSNERLEDEDAQSNTSPASNEPPTITDEDLTSILEEGVGADNKTSDDDDKPESSDTPTSTKDTSSAPQDSKSKSGKISKHTRKGKDKTTHLDAKPPMHTDEIRTSRIMTAEEEAAQEKMRRERHSGGRRRGAFMARERKPIGLDPNEIIEEPPKSCGGLCTAQSLSFLASEEDVDYNPEPKVTTQSCRFTISYADTVGRRKSMEDEMVICGQFRGRKNEDLFGVFDGHNGSTMATFVGKTLPTVLASILPKQNDPGQALNAAFLEVNRQAKAKKILGGSTGCAVLFVNNMAYIANAGDCRAVLHLNGEAKAITKDHKPEDADEEKRIRKLGGEVVTTVGRDGKIIGRVNGILGVSRAFGDFELEPYITCQPDIYEFEYTSDDSDDDFLIIACDGVWDVMSSEEATRIALPFIKDHKLEAASRRIRDVAFARTSLDNISVMVIKPLSQAEKNAVRKTQRSGFSLCAIV